MVMPTTRKSNCTEDRLHDLITPILKPLGYEVVAVEDRARRPASATAPLFSVSKPGLGGLSLEIPIRDATRDKDRDFHAGLQIGRIRPIALGLPETVLLTQCRSERF